MSDPEPIWVHVCVWDPQHTASVVHSQSDAVRNGTLARIVSKHGVGTPELKQAMVEAKLVTMYEDDAGEMRCVECDGLMERLMAKLGVADRNAAIQDVVNNFDAAIERTRDEK